MKYKIETYVRQFLNGPKQYPVEAVMGIVFFLIAFVDTTFDDNFIIGFDTDILCLYVPLISLTFFLGKISRQFYLVSGFLFVPLMLFDLDNFLWTYAFWFTYALASLLFVVGTHKMDNHSFSSHAIHVISQMFFGVLIAMLLNIAAFAIIASFLYIFSLDDTVHLFENITYFIWFVVAPQVCFTLISQKEYDEIKPGKVLTLILDYIISPAIVIYTFILYIYIAKITVEWNLPKGGVAWLVMAYISVALFGHLMQYVLKNRHYDWFYKRLTWISLLPLTMYWVGSVHRIGSYSFTESRFYLLLAGILMTLFVLMLINRRTRSFQIMTAILGATIILFTYIPGISARNIGLACQKARLDKYISSLNLIDTTTGKLTDNLDTEAIQRDTVLCRQYRETCNIISYVRQEMGYTEFDEHYGQWQYMEYQFDVSKNAAVVEQYYELKSSVSLGQYNVFVTDNNYDINYENGKMTVRNKSEKIVLEYPIDSIVKEYPDIMKDPVKPFVYSNDSLLILLRSIRIEGNNVKDVNTYDVKLFKTK